jgi:outer membrane receptor protein involved in Fe transport
MDRIKSRGFKLALAGSVAFGALLTGAAAHAAAAAPPAATTSSDTTEVIVTASKRRERLVDVANSVTAVQGADLDRRELVSFTDFQYQVPGLTIQQANGAFSKIIIRGQNAGGSSANVASTVDDIPFSFSGAIGDGGYLSGDIDTYDLQRVEVLRGPQGSLYGAAAEAGIVKYYTNPPNLRDFGGSVQGGIQAIGTDYKVGGTFRGLVNVPIIKDVLAVRAEIFREDTPGFINNPLLGKYDYNSATKNGGRLSVLYKPTEKFSARFSFVTQDSDADGDYSVEVVGATTLASTATPPANGQSLVHGLQWDSNLTPSYKKRYNVYGLDLEYDAGFAKLSSITSYTNTRMHYSADVNAYYAPAGLTYSQLFTVITGTPVLLKSDEFESLEKYSQEFRIASEPTSQLFNHPFDWQGGAFFTREDSGFFQPYYLVKASDKSPFNYPLGAAGLPDHYEEWAVFGEATYHFTPKFDVSLGGRYTDTTQNFHEYTIAGFLYPSTTTLVAPQTEESSTTWSAAARYHLDGDSLVYARVAKGFRPGGPQTPIPNAPAGYPTSFHSDSTINYEAGYRTELFQRTVSVDLTVYHIDWTNIQVLQTVTTTNGQQFNVTGNGGTATSDGLEYNFTWKPISGLHLGLLGAFNKAKLTEDAPGIGGFKGDRLPYVPNVSSTLNADYEWAAFGEYTAFAGGSLIYAGDRRTNVGKFVYSVTLPSYTMLNLQTGLRNGRYTLEGYIHNATDKRALTGYSSSGGAFLLGTGTILQPRTIGATLKVSF